MIKSTGSRTARFEEGPRAEQRSLSDYVREEPLLSLGVAALLGFVAGGGALTRTGMGALMLLGRMMAGQIALEAISKSVRNHGSGRRSSAY